MFFPDLAGESFQGLFGDEGMYVMSVGVYDPSQALVATTSLGGVDYGADYLAIFPLDAETTVTGLARGQVIVHAWIDYYSVM